MTSTLLSKSCLLFTAALFASSSFAQPRPASPVPAPQYKSSISAFSPQGMSESKTQVRATFSTNMIANGEHYSKKLDIFNINCSPARQLSGYWTDLQTLILSFQVDRDGNGLPAGTTCTFSLKPGVVDVDNNPVKPASFRFVVDGPSLNQVAPSSENAQISEDQAFILVASEDVDVESMRKNLRFVNSARGSAVSFKVITGDLRTKILKTELYNEKLVKNEKRAFVVQATEAFPANSKVQLIWGKGIASAVTKKGRQSDYKVDFTVRDELKANVTCPRENAQAGCNPFLPVTVQFSANVPAKIAAQVVLKDSKGKSYPTSLSKQTLNEKMMVTSVDFAGPFPANETFQVSLPSGIRDDAGRPLVNADRFPISDRTSEFPPLAKFPGSFGILETQSGDLRLPMAIRNMEVKALANIIGTENISVSKTATTVDGNDFPAVVNWLKRVNRASKYEYESRKESLFSKDESDRAAKTEIPLTADNKVLQITGVPLPGPGLHVVEIKSRLLGKSLLGADRDMHVSTAALATNLSVHLKWGVENSLAWVTELQSGRPAAHAKVAVADCDGTILWTGESDSNGIARIDGTVTKAASGKRCERPKVKDADGNDQTLFSDYDSGFFVVASRDKDFTFTHSGWNEGLNSYSFGIWNTNSPNYPNSPEVGTIVLDRTLFRAGEAVGMKFFVRTRSSNGFGPVDPTMLPKQVTINGMDAEGNSKKYAVDIKTWDTRNFTADAEWAIPKDAALGNYSISLGNLAFTSINVQEFTVPLMTGSLDLPPFSVSSEPVKAQFGLKYINGGPASKHKVDIRYQVRPYYGEMFKTYADFNFQGRKVVEGVSDGSDLNNEYEKDSPLVPGKLQLDANGVATHILDQIPAFKSISQLEVQMEYRDGNGKSHTVTQTRTVYPSSTLVGLKHTGKNPDYSPKKIRFEVATVGADGKPVKTGVPELRLYSDKTETHSVRLNGGVYVQESSRVVKRETAKFNCQPIRKQTRYSCSVSSPVTGSVIVQALTKDNMNREHMANMDLHVQGGRIDLALDPSDRVDLIPNKSRYRAGDVAEFRVDTNYDDATVLVTVEREGILSAEVHQLKDNNKVVPVKITENMTPNVYVSALIVRGRIEGMAPPKEIGAIDLAKPGFKMGLEAVSVNWEPNELMINVNPEKATYAPRETVAVNVEAKTKSGEAAAGAEVALAAIDEGLLQLQPNTTWDLLRNMMQERPHSVVTATGQTQVIGKRHEGAKAVPHGGGGGNVPTRELLDTRVSWIPKITLDGRGRARVTFPMNDILTKVRVAVAGSTLTRFGKGEGSFISKQDVSASSHIPNMARSGDNLSPSFGLRNTTDRTISVVARVNVEYTSEKGEKITQAGEAKTISIPPNEATELSMSAIRIPDGMSGARITVTLNEGSKVLDKLAHVMTITPAIPVRTQMAVINQVNGKLGVPVTRPPGAIEGKGGVRVSLLPSLAGNLSGVNDYFKDRNYESIEHQVSRAVALNDQTAWTSVVGKVANSLDNDGLVEFYPTAQRGDVGLTAYVLRIAAEAGFGIPEDTRAKMLQGLTGFVNGSVRIDGLTPARMTALKAAALNAVSRYYKLDPSVVATLGQVQPEALSTTTMLDWLEVLLVTQGASRADAQKLQNALQSRWSLTSSTITWKQPEYYYLSSENINTARVLLAAVRSESLSKSPEWGGRVAQLITALNNRLRQNGHWGMSLANAWGSVALRAYSAKFEKDSVAGTTYMQLGTEKAVKQWADANGASTFTLAYPQSGNGQVGIAHQGQGKPWSIVATQAAINVTSKIESGFDLERTVEPMKDTYKVGDKVKVTLRIRNSVAAENVVLTDYMVPGANVLGQFGTGFSEETGRTTGSYPSFTQASQVNNFRAFYTYLGTGDSTISYQVELTAPGTFKIPGARVEGLYSPERFGELPPTQIAVEKL